MNSGNIGAANPNTDAPVSHWLLLLLKMKIKI